MLKTKCFIVGGMILSSSLQAEVSEPVKKTGDDPKKAVLNEDVTEVAKRVFESLTRCGTPYAPGSGYRKADLAKARREMIEREVLNKTRSEPVKDFEKVVLTPEEIELRDKLIALEEKEDLERQVEKHEDEILQLKIKVDSLERQINKVRSNQILYCPGLHRQMRP